MKSVNVREVPDDLYRKAKATAALQGRTIKAVFIAALEDLITNQEKQTDVTKAKRRKVSVT